MQWARTPRAERAALERGPPGPWRSCWRARAAGARVAAEPTPGYGRACLTAIAALRLVDVVLFVDGDQSCRIGQAFDLLRAVAAGADLVIGSRALGRMEPGALSPPQIAGNRVASVLIRLLWGRTVTDLGPFRAIRWPALSRLGMTDPDYGWTAEMQLKAARSGIASVEVPVTCRRRRGRSKISGTFGGSLLAGIKILLTVLLPVEGPTGAAAAEARADR